MYNIIFKKSTVDHLICTYTMYNNYIINQFIGIIFSTVINCALYFILIDIVFTLDRIYLSTLYLHFNIIDINS